MLLLRPHALASVTQGVGPPYSPRGAADTASELQLRCVNVAVNVSHVATYVPQRMDRAVTRQSRLPSDSIFLPL